MNEAFEHYRRKDVDVYASPGRYAYHLASYITDPERIVKLCEREFGRSPGIETVAQFQRDHKETRREFTRLCSPPCKDSDRHDGLHFKPRGLVKPLRQVRTVERRAPMPLDRTRYTVPKVVQDLINGVASDFNMDADAIMGTCRRKPYGHARAVISMILRERNPRIWSYAAIGKLLGGRDHSSIMHYITNFAKYARESDLVASTYHARRGQ
jgi:hypothetical protein